MNFFAKRAERRRRRTEAAVVGALLLGDQYVNDLWRRIGGSTGDIYPALARLENEGTVQGKWTERPWGSQQRCYSLTLKALGECNGTVIHLLGTPCPVHPDARQDAAW